MPFECQLATVKGRARTHAGHHRHSHAHTFPCRFSHEHVEYRRSESAATPAYAARATNQVFLCVYLLTWTQLQPLQWIRFGTIWKDHTHCASFGHKTRQPYVFNSPIRHLNARLTTGETLRIHYCIFGYVCTLCHVVCTVDARQLRRRTPHGQCGVIWD